VHKHTFAYARHGTYRVKSEKGLAQAEWLIEALAESLPFELLDALKQARSRGLNWRRVIERSLDREPEIKEMISHT